MAVPVKLATNLKENLCQICYLRNTAAYLPSTRRLHKGKLVFILHFNKINKVVNFT